MDGSQGTNRESIFIHGHGSPGGNPLDHAWENPHLEITAGLSESQWERKGPAGHMGIQERGGVGIGSGCHMAGKVLR